ncbi:Zinc transporter ZIP6 [Triplophysa tibetana]|uniref:Zinc transporter ZIP6 n=1 Tax=Triplophysa tibetana TaxID=1572043 RepID=A0A5A9PD43_9TELE|nr:Zinc transporter ZIP6 [Triplophysa tibetana]
MIGGWPRLLTVTSLALLVAFSVGAGPECRSVTIETDSRIAEQVQERHLQALFEKYGQNGSISLEGLYNLLTGVGLGHIRKVMVHHHGNTHNNTNSHSNSHTHVDKLTTHAQAVASKKVEGDHTVEKSEPVTKVQPDPAPGKKSESDAHHNLYMKVNQELTTPLTTPSAATKLRRTNRSADYDLTQDHASFAVQPNVTHTNHTHQAEDAHTHVHEDDHDEHEHIYHSLECQNASTILHSHGMVKESGVSVSDFAYLCPALLMQMDSKSCLVHDNGQLGGIKPIITIIITTTVYIITPMAEAKGVPLLLLVSVSWIGGFLSITLISLLALVGVVLIPLMNRVCFNFLLSFLVALAVGTLSGDAFLHLIPHSQGHNMHSHSEHHNHGEEGEEDSLRPVWTGLTALSGVYIMFLIEHFLTLGKMYKDKKQKKRVDLAAEVLESEKQPSLEDNGVKTLDAAETNGGSACARGVAEEEEVMLGAELYTDIDCENKCHSHFHDTVGQSDEQHHHHHDYHHILHHHHSQNHHPHTHTHRHTQSYSLQHFQQAGVATLAWMVIMGDGLHNFSDGLAIGNTSVAVFCHELPHELGDFAVLLKAGMSVRQAILYNLLSALMGYLGMITGILIGHYAENVSMWIFALTAGLFLYVALVDMVPEMLHNDASEAGFSHYGFFLLQNAGILLGFGIMLVIAIFEHKIQVDIGF